MNIMRPLALAFAMIAPSLAFASGQNPWVIWEHTLHRECPNRHVDWIGDGGYDELLAAFEKTLPPTMQKRIARITSVEYERYCTNSAGFSCEMGVGLDAFRRLDLLGRFTKFGCEHVECEEIALCSKVPHVR